MGISAYELREHYGGHKKRPALKTPATSERNTTMGKVTEALVGVNTGGLLGVQYRIAHIASDSYYTTHGWGPKVAAEVYTAEDRLKTTLPLNGCWELVTAPVPIAAALDRSLVAQTIAQLLLALQRREDATAVGKLDRFQKAGELIVQLVLNPDLEQTAVLAAADVICQGSYGDDALTIHDSAPSQQRRYLRLAQSAVNAYRQMLVFQSHDAAGDDRLCRLLDDLTRNDALEGGAA